MTFYCSPCQMQVATLNEMDRDHSHHSEWQRVRLLLTRAADKLIDEADTKLHWRRMHDRMLAGALREMVTWHSPSLNKGWACIECRKGDRDHPCGTLMAWEPVARQVLGRVEEPNGR